MLEQIAAAEQARYAALAAEAEQGAFGPIDGTPGAECEPDFDAVLAGVAVDETVPTPTPAPRAVPGP